MTLTPSLSARKESVPLVLLFGPSGSGKSSLGKALAEQVQWLYIETDPYSRSASSVAPPACLAQLFSPNPNFANLATELRGLSHSRRGVVLSFISVICPLIEHINAAKKAGLTTIFLYGEEAHCLQAFLHREKRNGRNLPESHWHTYNTGIFRALERPEYKAHLLHSILEGHHRPLEELVHEVLQRVST